MKNLFILFLFFGISLQAQVCKEYTCTFQGKQYTVNIGVFSPNDDGSIIIKKEKPNGEFTLKSYDFYSYEPMGYLYVEKGNTERRVILEKDLYNHITGITFLYKEEKFLYKPISK